MFEKAVMRDTKALAGVLGDDWTTAIRLVDCCVVRAAADDTDGNIKDSTASIGRSFFIVIFIYI